MKNCDDSIIHRETLKLIQDLNNQNEKSKYIYEKSRYIITTYLEEAPLKSIQLKSMLREIQEARKETLPPKPIHPRKIIKPPGSVIMEMSEFLFSKAFHINVITQTIADAREEYFEALAENRTMKARWIHVRMYVSLLATLPASVTSSVLKHISDWIGKSAR